MSQMTQEQAKCACPTPRLNTRARPLGAPHGRPSPGSPCRLCDRVGPRHGANSGGGNEPRFRPAGEVKNIVYENRGVFNKYYLL